MQTMCGTPDFMAPEICRLERYDCKVDTWALGVTLFMMCIIFRRLRSGANPEPPTPLDFLAACPLLIAQRILICVSRVPGRQIFNGLNCPITRPNLMRVCIIVCMPTIIH